jgi:hypothetical protein
MEELTDAERHEVRIQRWVWFLWESTFGIVAASR